MNTTNVFNKEAFCYAIENSEFSKKEIAEMVGCTIHELYKYMRPGEACPRYRRLLQFVEILGPEIAGIKINREPNESLFTEDERHFLAWFRRLSRPRMGKVLGFASAVYEFGISADAEFAADFGGKLIDEEEQRRERQG